MCASMHALPLCSSHLHGHGASHHVGGHPHARTQWCCPQGSGQESRLDWALCSLPPQLPSDSSTGLLIKARTEGTEARGGEEREGKFILVLTRHAASSGVTYFLGLGQVGVLPGGENRKGREDPFAPPELPGNVPPLGKLCDSLPPPSSIPLSDSSSTPSGLLSQQLASPHRHTPVWAC